jgi:hypothetical protein
VTPSSARALAAAIIATPLLAYPLAVGAVGAGFPSQDDCVRRASPGDTGELDLVFGRRDTVPEAERLLEQVRGVGYKDAEVQGDGCARWKVLYDGIESYEQGASSAEQAHGAGLEAWLEIEPPG